MKKNKLYILMIVLIFILSISLILQSSLGKYRKQANVDYRIDVSSWNILVNNETINKKDILYQDLVPISISNPYVMDGAIAPGSAAYCDITIDSSQVTLPFSFTLTPSILNSEIPDLIVQSYIINPSDTNTITTPFGDAITYNVDRNVNSTIVRLYVTWIDEGTMSNEEDTVIGTTYPRYPINIRMEFSQLNE